MERGGRFHRYRRHAKQQASISSAASSGVNSRRVNNSPNANLPANLNPSQANDTNPTMVPNPQQPPQSTVREQDQFMPIANVIRIMRRVLPAHAKISDDAKETIQECVSEYISFITGEANDRCQHEQRKTITAEDVLWSMGKLGFDNYVEPLTLFLNRYRETENERGSVRDPVLKRSNVGVVDYGNIGVPPFMPNFAMGPLPPQGVLDPTMFGAYYRHVSDADAGVGMGGPSSSNNPYINFDPFAQFK